MEIKTYTGVGSLAGLVKEENKRRDIKMSKLIEAGEYFQDHTYQDKDSKEHDIDFKSKPADVNNKSVTPDDYHIPNDIEKKMDKADYDTFVVNSDKREDLVNPKGLDFYLQKKKKEGVGDKEKVDYGDATEDANKNLNTRKTTTKESVQPDYTNFHKKLREYMDNA